jgi:hypothetical protein
MVSPESLVEQPSSAAEIAELLHRFRVAIEDARLAEQSVDGRYVDAYTAGFLLAKVVLRASGYRVRGGENHRDTFAAVPWLMGTGVQATVDALDAARKKRNADLYDGAGLVDERDVSALLARTAEFEIDVLGWLRERHRDLIEPDER